MKRTDKHRFRHEPVASFSEPVASGHRATQPKPPAPSSLWRTLLLTLAFSLTLTHLSAQDGGKWIARGDSAYKAGDYTHAIEYYEWAERKTSDWRASLGLARCWRALMDYQRAKDFYAKVVDQENAPIETYFHYGQALMATRNYPEAEQWFAKYAKAAPADPRAAVFRDLDKLVTAVMRDSGQYEVQRLPINGKWSDFAPAFYENGILFASARPNEMGVLHSSTVNDAPLLDLYFTAPDTAGRWSNPKSFTPLNSKLNEGPLVVDSLTGSVFVTRNDPYHRKNRDKKTRQGLNRLQIDAFSLEDGKLKPAGPLPFNDSRYAVGHPALSPDGTLLYFSSDMPGGYGGTDIYVSEWKDDHWNPAHNLGSMVNTPEDELFPFIDAQSQLYFASNGHLGMGGLDLFFTQRLPDGEWSRVQNLGYPLNSEADDFGLILQPSGSDGYFSSNRKADPSDDNIYSFKRLWPKFECSPQIANNYCFKFWETGVVDGDSLPLAYEWDFGDGFKARGLETRHCYEQPGFYHVQLNLIDTLAGFLFLTQVEYELPVTDTAQVYIDCPERVGVGEDFQISAEKSILQGCSIQKHYWEMGDGKRETAQQFTHHYDLPGTYTIRLGVTGDSQMGEDWVCKNCVTKTVQVMPLSEMQDYRDSVTQDRQHQLANQERWKHSPLVENLLESGKKEFDLRDSAQTGKYSVKLGNSTEPINPKSPLFKGIRDLREIPTADGFEIYSGLKDSLSDIRPYFVEAHKLGFDDAVVVVVQDSLQKKVFKIPGKRTSTGYTLFDGQVLDPNGQPLQAEITFEEIEKGLEVYKTRTDSMGRVKMKLPNGKIYMWNADLQDYFPASGYLDLIALSEAPNATVTLREKITLRQMSELLASGESVRINNIFFDFDSHQLRPESQRQLQRLVGLLKDYPDFGVVVMAHTDNWGNDAYNMDLSRRRAQSVMEYLTMTGCNMNSIRSEGYGESRPVVANDTPENRQFNRRVEFRFYPTKEQ